jgi:hypothetical protein
MSPSFHARTLVCAAATCFFLSGSVSASVPECTPVSGDRILAADLAKIEPSFAALDPTTDLGPAPLTSIERFFRPAELARLAQKYQLVTSQSAEDTPDPASPAHDVCFRRQTQSLSEPQLLPVLRAALDASTPAALSTEAPSAQLQIEVLDFSRNALPLGALEFLHKDLSPTGLWRGRLLYGAGRSVPLWVQVRITDLSTGEVVAVPRSIAGKTKPAVERGQAIQVEVARGGVHLGFEASAESSGHIGEAVVLRNPANGQRLRGVVTAEGKVTVRP